MSVYNHTAIEEKWQQHWEENKLFLQTEAQEVSDIKDKVNGEARGGALGCKMYLLFAFAYPSGSGLHVGHVESKTALDILARYYRMNGKSVFFPVGWDAFGLPAENYAIKTGVPPVETTKSAINTFRRQLKRIGISYDWSNEIATCHPGYYQWTQWLFLQLYNAGLAYQDKGMVNWCPSCQTVLANEQVVDGECERCDTEVTQKDMEQWFFKITEYKDELISGLDQVDWPEPTKQQQLNWIGKSQGVTYKQKVKGMDIELEAYDSVPQTFMAQTFCVIAPENPLLKELVKDTEHEQLVADFVESFKKKKIQDRFHLDKDVEGIFTGKYIENPFGTGDLPIWVATFVIADYGSGFVNSSAHDQRDFDFAKKYDIPLRPVMFPSDPVEAKKVRDLEYCYHHAVDGVLEQPAEFSGRIWNEVREDIISYVEEKGFGQATTQYKLRDWLISRQRYWGAPIPIVYDPEGKPHPVKEEHLPWTLPTDVDFKPTGESPLRSSVEFKERTEKLYGKGWTPEYDTMDTFVDSSWYYLRYVAARDETAFSDKDQLQKWLPVDFYMIGPEHIVLHLLYARFFTKFLRDQGHLNFDEPFLKMRHQGMILGPDGKKMSKSKGNVINPDDVIEKFGADTLRMYEMFIGPIEADKPWDTSSVSGNYRFLSRVHRLVQTWSTASNDLETTAHEGLKRKLHQTIKKVSSDIPALKFNTAIAAMMGFINVWEAAVKEVGHSRVMTKDEVVAFIKILAPFAPFLAEELYQVVAENLTESLHLDTWPEWDEVLALEKQITIAVQVNGKVRGEVTVAYDQLEEKEAVLAAALKVDTVQAHLDGKKIVKEIYVPGKIVSLVVK
jgi:leucyl-tRNA synthetase